MYPALHAAAHNFVETIIIGRNLVNGLEIRGVRVHMNRDTVRVNPTTGDTLFTASSSHCTSTRRGLLHIFYSIYIYIYCNESNRCI